MPGLFNETLNVPSVLARSVAAGTYVTSTVGNLYQGAASITGASITAAIGEAADIAAPEEGNWTNIISLSGKYQIMWVPTGTSRLLTLTVKTGEDAGDAMRFQVIIDGTTAWDQTVIRNASGDVSQYLMLVSQSTDAAIIQCSASFVLRGVRKGTFTDASTLFYYGAFYYNTLR